MLASAGIISTLPLNLNTRKRHEGRAVHQFFIVSVCFSYPHFTQYPTVFWYHKYLSQFCRNITWQQISFDNDFFQQTFFQIAVIARFATWPAFLKNFSSLAPPGNAVKDNTDYFDDRLPFFLSLLRTDLFPLSISISSVPPVLKQKH